jgi:hypothetical protein
MTMISTALSADVNTSIPVTTIIAHGTNFDMWLATNVYKPPYFCCGVGYGVRALKHQLTPTVDDCMVATSTS